MGSKNRIAKYILPLMLKERKPNQCFVDIFCGGCNIVDKVGGNRIANDINKYLIAMFKELVNGWNPPLFVSKDEYLEIKNNKGNYPDYLVGYVGFNSFGARFFNTYRNDERGLRTYWTEYYNNLMKQIPNLKNIIFENKSYDELKLPENSLIYCDPPYQNTTKYKDEINYDRFWNWCIEKKNEGHTIFISELKAPEQFKCIWSKDLLATTSMNNYKTQTERLFTC